jgi:transcriptional regulator with XRE-family HTH domain
MSNRKGKSLDTDQQVYEKIGKRIKELRLKAGYTAADKFAYENEIGRSQYAAWEVGQDMRVSSLLRITKAHRISIEEFFEGIK